MRSQTRRPRGTGSLYEYRGAWYATFWVGGRQVKRKVGPKRKPGTREGLTRVQAEAHLRRIIEETRVAPPQERLTLSEAAERYVRHVELVMERKPSTVQDYRIMLRRHFEPFFRGRAMDKVGPDDLTAYMQTKARSGLSSKTINNHVTLLHGIFNYAVKRGWVSVNPVALVDRPRQSGADPDIRFLEMTEVEALVRATPDDAVGRMERVLYLTAAMTGLRQGELIALRWQDVDWTAGGIRVRRSRTRGKLGTPKSRRSVRAVPMNDRLAGELERHFQQSAFQSDDALVFAHPETGSAYDPSKMRSRFKQALKRAGITRPVRFHDLRHTFGTHMAGAGVPMRTLQEWMGHRSLQTTERYADYSPRPQEREWAELAFAGNEAGNEVSASEDHQDQGKPLENEESLPEPTA
jgi:integrase